MKFIKLVVQELANTVFEYIDSTKMTIVSLGRRGVEVGIDPAQPFEESDIDDLVDQKTYMRGYVAARGRIHQAYGIEVELNAVREIEPLSDIVKIDVGDPFVTFLRFGQD